MPPYIFVLYRDRNIQKNSMWQLVTFLMNLILTGNHIHRLGAVYSDNMPADYSRCIQGINSYSYTDLRSGMGGLAAMVREQFKMEPLINALILFCGRQRERIKALYWEVNELYFGTSDRSLDLFNGCIRKAKSGHTHAAILMIHRKIERRPTKGA